MRIIINIEDDKVFAQIAFILDQENVVNKIKEIRKCWLLDQKLIEYGKFDEWYKEPHYEFELTSEVADYWNAAKDNLSDFSFTRRKSPISEQFAKEIIDSNPMELEIEHLQRKNGIPTPYKMLIIKAISTGEINPTDWENMNWSEKFYHSNQWFNLPIFEKLYGGNPKQAIKRDREWYWMKKDGYKLLEIAKETTYRPKHIAPPDYVDTLKHAIQRYKTFLKFKGHTQTS